MKKQCERVCSGGAHSGESGCLSQARAWCCWTHSKLCNTGGNDRAVQRRLAVLMIQCNNVSTNSLFCVTKNSSGSKCAVRMETVNHMNTRQQVFNPLPSPLTLNSSGSRCAIHSSADAVPYANVRSTSVAGSRRHGRPAAAAARLRRRAGTRACQGAAERGDRAIACV